jgi:hypothetical protein
MTVKRRLAFGTASPLVDVLGKFVVRWAEGTVKVDVDLLEQQHKQLTATSVKDLSDMAAVHLKLVDLASKSGGILDFKKL